MAITIDGTNGLTTDNAALKLDGTTLVVDDTNDRVGIGTSSPSGKLHVEGGTENAIIGSSTRKLYFRADSGGMMLGTGAVQTGNGIYFNEASNYLYFQTNSIQRIRIDSDGLKFGTDTAAANALDDYEEGVFTPSLTGTGGGTATTQSGASTMGYTKIGRVVTINGDVRINTTSGLSGDLLMSIPFVITNITDYAGRGGCLVPVWDSSASGYVNTRVFVNEGASTIQFSGISPAAGDEFRFTVTYFTD